ncbi:substrate-binding periplasmic protein [Motiliproteus sp.]|uniref:substrate-binding periplasmic protein n=1 Tax=Motiliproteus sp. TaxID=1898955 RepID=UPI003BAC0B73
MQRTLWALLLVLILGRANAEALDDGCASSLEQIQWLSEHYAPYNFVGEQGKPTGMTTEILLTLFKRLGAKVDAESIVFLPWARSYRTIQIRPDHGLFSTTITLQREKLFTFVGPIVPITVALIAKRDKQLRISSVEDMNDLRIGTVKDDIGEQLLLEAGVNPQVIQRTSYADNLVIQLIRGRLDAIAYASQPTFYYMNQLGDKASDYELIHVFSEGQMGVAFHPATDPLAIACLQEALNQLKAEGGVEAVINRYIGELPQSE